MYIMCVSLFSALSRKVDIIRGSSHKYDFCRDKHVSRENIFSTKHLSWQIFVATNTSKRFVATKKKWYLRQLPPMVGRCFTNVHYYYYNPSRCNTDQWNPSSRYTDQWNLSRCNIDQRNPSSCNHYWPVTGSKEKVYFRSDHWNHNRCNTDQWNLNGIPAGVTLAILAGVILTNEI